MLGVLLFALWLDGSNYSAAMRAFVESFALKRCIAY